MVEGYPNWVSGLIPDAAMRATFIERNPWVLEDGKGLIRERSIRAALRAYTDAVRSGHKGLVSGSELESVLNESVATTLVGIERHGNRERKDGRYTEIVHTIGVKQRVAASFLFDSSMLPDELRPAFIRAQNSNSFRTSYLACMSVAMQASDLHDAPEKDVKDARKDGRILAVDDAVQGVLKDRLAYAAHGRQSHTLSHMLRLLTPTDAGYPRDIDAIAREPHGYTSGTTFIVKAGDRGHNLTGNEGNFGIAQREAILARTLYVASAIKRSVLIPRDGYVHVDLPRIGFGFDTKSDIPPPWYLPLHAGLTNMVDAALAECKKIEGSIGAIELEDYAASIDKRFSAEQEIGPGFEFRRAMDYAFLGIDNEVRSYHGRELMRHNRSNLTREARQRRMADYFRTSYKDNDLTPGHIVDIALEGYHAILAREMIKPIPAKKPEEIPAMPIEDKAAELLIAYVSMKLMEREFARMRRYNGDYIHGFQTTPVARSATFK